MQPIEFRAEAREHLKAAKKMLADAGEASARYACLELRMTIEAMTYELFALYLKEMPRSAISQWPPNKVIRELLAADPLADQTSAVRIRRARASGEAQSAAFEADDHRFTAKWASKAHNALGSFLHTPTVGQRERGLANQDQAMRAKCAEVLRELEPMVSRPYFHFTMAEFVTVDCECKATFKRRPNVLAKDPVAECVGCGARWVYDPDPSSADYRFHLQQAVWDCPGCGVKQGMAAHLLEGLPEVACACGTRLQIAAHYGFDVLDAAGVVANDTGEDGGPKAAAWEVSLAPSPLDGEDPSQPPSEQG
ncbi:MAG: hypothetical protein AB1942_24995 [Pseudomonadota bacterium]